MLRDLAGALLLQGLLAAWLTWPLVAHLDTDLPATVPACRFDTLYSAWILAWQTAAWLAGRRVADANIYVPAANTLFYGSPGYGALPWFAPVFALTQNPALALNCLFLVGVTATASAAHAVVQVWTGSFAAGAVAGATLLANRWLLWDIGPTAPRLVILGWLPFCIAATVQPRSGIRAACVVAVLVALQGLSDPVYLAPAVIAPLAALALLRSLRPPTRPAGLSLLGALALASLVLATLHWPLLAMRVRHPELSRQSFWAVDAPPPIELPAGLMAPLSPVAVPTVILALIAFGTLARLLGPKRSGPDDTGAWQHAVWWIVAGVALSLLGNIRLGNEASAPLLGGVLRAPQRLGVVALVGLAILAGLAMAEARRIVVGRCTPRRARPFVVALLAGAVIGVSCLQYRTGVGQPRAYGGALPERYPLARAISGISPVVEELRAGDGPLFEGPVLPLSPTAPEVHARAMYRSIFHWRPLVNGYNSYWPASFPRHMALAARLPAADALAALRRETGLRWVLIDLEAPVEGRQLLGAARRRWAALAAAGGSEHLRLVRQDGPLALFRVAGDAPPDESAPTQARPLVSSLHP